MNRTYKFSDKASLSSDQSNTLAKIILDSPLQIRRKIKKDLGLAVELDSERIRVSHDGRKVGIASFPTTGGEITVVVGPKTDTLRLKALFAALGEDQLGGNQVRFERASWVTPTVRDESDFTPAFLLNLLQEITVLSTQLFGGPGRKRVTTIHGGVKGRPLLQK